MSLNKLQDTEEDRGAWRAAVHGVTKSRTRLSDSTAKCEQYAMNKAAQTCTELGGSHYR